MPIRDQDLLEWKVIKGVDDTSTVGTPGIESTLSVGLNCDLVDDSLIVKRHGYLRLNSAGDWSTRRIRGGLYYSTSNENLLYGEAATPTGTSGILGKLNGTGTPTTIVSSLVDDIKPSIIQVKDRVFVFNGTDDFQYDGTTTRQIGITAPSSAPTLSTTIDGGLVLGGAYLVAYSYYNSTTGAESSPSPVSATLSAGTSSTTDGLRISVVAGDSTTADKIRVYRSYAGGDTLFWNKDVVISSTTVDLTEADSALDFQMELDNDRPAKGKYAILNDNRIFLGGFTGANKNRVVYSKIGINGPMPESFQALDIADCNPNDGDTLLGLGKANNLTIVVKSRSVGRLSPIDFNTQGVELEGSTKYIYEEISSGVTGVGHHAGTSVDNWYIWLGLDDIYGTDGQQIVRLGKRIRNTIKNLNFTKGYKFSAVNKKDTTQIIFSVCRSGQSEPDFQIVGNYRNFPSDEIYWTFYSPGTSTSTHPGLQMGAIWETVSSNVRYYYFGTSSNLGRIYQLDYGTNDDTLGIYWKVAPAWISGRSKAKYKLFHSFYVFVLGNGTQYNLEHDFNIENSSVSSASASTAITSGSGTNWNSSNWNAFNWSDDTFQLVKFFPRKRAYTGRNAFYNYNADQPIAIKGMTGIIQDAAIHR